VDQIEGVDEETAEILKAQGIETIYDILNTNTEKLSTLLGIGEKKAEKIIQSAKLHVEGK